MGLLGSIFGGKKDAPPLAEMEALIRNFVHKNKVLKVLGEARAKRELGRQAEADSSYSVALEMANRVCAAYGDQDYMPLCLRAIVNLERGAEDQALADIQAILQSRQYSLDSQGLMILRGYEQKLAARQESSSEVPITTVYTCSRCGYLQHFATLPCVECNFIAVDLTTLAQSLLLSSKFASIGQLVFAGRAIKSGRKPYDVVPNLIEQARNIESQFTGNLLSEMMGLLEDGANYDWIDIAVILFCENCNNELTVGVADSCMDCRQPINRAEMEQRIITASRVKIGLEQNCAISDKSTYDRVVEGVVLVWSHIIQNQEKPSSPMARRVLDAFRQNGPLIWEGRGAVFDCSKAPEIQVYQIASDLDPKDEPFTKLFAMNLQVFLKQLAECV